MENNYLINQSTKRDQNNELPNIETKQMLEMALNSINILHEHTELLVPMEDNKKMRDAVFSLHSSNPVGL